MKRPDRIVPWLALALAVTACQPRPVSEPPQAVHPEPTFDLQAALASGEPVYRIDPAASRIDILVRRGGALARLGHDHVLIGTELEGWAYWPQDPGSARAVVQMPVDRLDVDPEAARRRYGLDTQPGAAAIQGTRGNLRDRVLMADRWPLVSATAGQLEPGTDDWLAQVAFRVRDHVLVRQVPLEITRGDERLAVQGSLLLNHGELGLEPFTALAGALRVADPIEVHFALGLQREHAPGRPADGGR